MSATVTGQKQQQSYCSFIIAVTADSLLLPGTSLEPAVTPTPQDSSFTLLLLLLLLS
jgi:hypothetical protein